MTVKTTHSGKLAAATVTSVIASPTSGDEGVGKTITLTVDMSEAVTVTGTPTLSLNDGGTATYTGGSGTNALTFTYTVGATNTSVAALAITGVNLHGGAVVNSAGVAAQEGALLTTFTGLQIDATTPAVTKVVASPGTGTEVPGNTITLTLDMSEAVTVTGKPTLSLNDGGTATYSGGSGTNALTFTYTVGATNSAESALAITGANLNGGAIVNGAGTAANLSGAAATLTGLAIDPPAGPVVSTAAPAVSDVVASPASGDEGVGKTITLTVAFNQAVTVTGTPTLNLNDGGTATYTGGSGTEALTFSYTVGATNTSVAALAVTGANLPNGATIDNSAGTAANLSSAATTLTGLQIDTTTPAVTKVVAAPGTGTEVPGDTITLTLDMSEAVTVKGTPTLTLNDGGTATYSGGSGTSALTFSYTVGATNSSVAALAVTGANLNGGSIVNGAGTAANLSGSAATLAGLAIDPPATATVSELVASPASGDEGAGKTITLTLDMSEAVTVTGTPTLTLNDGGTATYSGGSGTSALTFSYTVGATNTSVAALAVTGANLPNGATIDNSAGTAANLSSAATTLTGLQIDTATPAVTDVLASPGTGTEAPGDTVTLTVDMSEAVTVTGTPTLTLNDGGAATYTGGSGTDALTFSYTVGATNSAESALAVTGANLNGGSIVNGAGTAANLSGAAATFAGLAIDPSSTTTVGGYADGSATAPAGTPELPNLFSGYATRPPWEVAGVDYAVGVPAGTTLKDPESLASMAGVSVNMTTHQITVTGNNVTLNGYDFSMEGGWGIYVEGNNCTIENCNFAAGSNWGANAPYFIWTTSSVNNLTVEGCTLNGNGQTYQNMSGLVQFAGSGTFTVQNNYMENSPQHFVEVTNSGTATLIDQYNVFMNGAFSSGTGPTPHLNYVQETGSGALVNSVIQFNTMVQDQPSGNMVGGGQMIQVSPLAGPVDNMSVNNNVVIAQGGSSIATTYLIAVNQATGQGTINGAIVQDNYIDASGAYGAFFPPVNADGPVPTALTITNNVNLVTGTDFASIAGAAPSDVTSVVASPTSGTQDPGAVVTLTVNLAEDVTVTGTPTLTLNTGGVATYTGGSGTSALTFSYTVGSHDATVPALAITQVNLPNGATVDDSVGNAANLSGALVTFANLAIDPPDTLPEVTQVTASPGSGVEGIGSKFSLTVSLNEAVTVSGGVPTLTLNDGGTATYDAAATAALGNPTELVFDTTVAPGDVSASALAVTGVDVNGATVQDAAGNNANFSGALTTLTGLAIDANTPTVTGVVATPVSGDEHIGDKMTLTVDLDEAVTVSGGVPTLRLNDGGTAVFDQAATSALGNASNELVFDYTVGASDTSSPALAVTGVNLNGALISDVAGNTANLSGVATTLAGVRIDAVPSLHLLSQYVAAANALDGSGGGLGGAVPTAPPHHDIVFLASNSSHFR